MELKEKTGRLSAYQWAVLAAVLALGAGLRLYGLGEQSLWYDEAWSLSYAARTEAVSDLFDTGFSTDAPLFNVLLKGWTALLGPMAEPARLSARDDAALRVLPLIFGLLSLVLVFIVSRDILRGFTPAAAATFLYAISSYQIRYAQELRNYTLWTVLWLAALFFAVRAMRGNRRRDWAGLAVAEALMLYTHFFSPLLILPLNMYVFSVLAAGKNTRDPRIKPWLVSQAAAFILMLPALLMLVRVMAIANNITYHWYMMHGPKVALIAFKSLFAGFSPNTMIYWPVFVAAGAFFCLGLWALRRRWDIALLLGAVVVFPLVVNVVLTYLNGYSRYELRLFVPSAIAAYMLAGAGIAALPRARFRALAAVSMGALMLPLTGDYYAGRLHPFEAHRVGIWDKVNFRDAARHIRQNAEEGDVVAHPGHFSVESFRLYLPEMPHSMVGHSELERHVMIGSMGCGLLVERNELLADPLQDVAGRARRVWFVDSAGVNFNWPPLVASLREWLETNAVRVDFREFDRVTVTCYRTSEPGHPELSRDRLESGGFDWSVESSGVSEVEIDGSFAYKITVKNHGEAAKKIQCAVYETAGAVEPLAWHREDPLTNPWRPYKQYDLETGGFFNRQSMTATLGAATGESAEMRGWSLLPPGRYAPFVRVLEIEEGESRATGTVAVEPGGLSLGALDCAAGLQGNGWNWRRLGEFESAGGVTWFTLKADNSRNLDTAWFQIEKILFLELENADVDGAPVSQQFEIELEPGETRELAMQGQMGALARRRVDFEAFDPDTRTYGTVTLHAEAAY